MSDFWVFDFLSLFCLLKCLSVCSLEGRSSVFLKLGCFFIAGKLTDFCKSEKPMEVVHPQIAGLKFNWQNFLLPTYLTARPLQLFAVIHHASYLSSMRKWCPDH